jgi:putative membrane protein
MRTRILSCLRAAAIGALAFSLPAFAQYGGSSNSSKSSNTSNTASQKSPSDANFLDQISTANQMEVATAKMAQDKASNPMVKDFAKQLQDDHQDAQAELQQIAQKDNLNVQTNNNAQAPKTLANLSGSQFDQKFIQDEIRDHQKTISKLEREKSTLQSQDVKNYVTDILPTLQAHLKTAQDIASQLGIRSMASNTMR